MSNDWINIRFGVRHLHVGPWYVNIKVNSYHIENPPKSRFEVYKFPFWR